MAIANWPVIPVVAAISDRGFGGGVAACQGDARDSLTAAPGKFLVVIGQDRVKRISES